MPSSSTLSSLDTSFGWTQTQKKHFSLALPDNSVRLLRWRSSGDWTRELANRFWVLSIAIPILILTHRYCFSPITKGFVGQALPNLITWYRGFLNTQLQRDYEIHAPIFLHKRLWVSAVVVFVIGLGTAVSGTFLSGPGGPSPLIGISALFGLGVIVLSITAVIRTPNPYLQNSFCFLSLMLGVVLAVIGGIILGMTNPAAGTVLLYPAAILFVMGMLMVILHCLEVIYLNGLTSVKAGGFFAILSSSILGLMALIRGAELQTILILLSLPAIVMGVGGIGYLLNGRLLKQRTRLLLTDNRARLLVCVAGGFVSIIALFAAAPTGVEFFPDTDPKYHHRGPGTPPGNTSGRNQQDYPDCTVQH